MSVRAYRVWVVSAKHQLRSVYARTFYYDIVTTADRIPELGLQRYTFVGNEFSPVHSSSLLAVFVTKTGDKRLFCMCRTCRQFILMQCDGNLSDKGDLVLGKTTALLESTSQTGIWAFKELSEAQTMACEARAFAEDIVGLPAGQIPLVAVGAVDLFGHVVEHEKGYRAEKCAIVGPVIVRPARPYAFDNRKDDIVWACPDLKPLEDRYQCDFQWDKSFKEKSL